jgi:hypothetical protein
MMHDQDERIGALLRENAPPERDALFRLAVLERREQKRFRRHSAMLLAAALVTLAIVAVTYAMSADLVTAAIAAMIAATLMGACLLSVPGALEIRRRLHGRREIAGKN